MAIVILAVIGAFIIAVVLLSIVHFVVAHLVLVIVCLAAGGPLGLYAVIALSRGLIRKGVTVTRYEEPVKPKRTMPSPVRAALEPAGWPAGPGMSAGPFSSEMPAEPEEKPRCERASCNEPLPGDPYIVDVTYKDERPDESHWFCSESCSGAWQTEHTAANRLTPGARDGLGLGSPPALIGEV